MTTPAPADLAARYAAGTERAYQERYARDDVDETHEEAMRRHQRMDQIAPNPIDHSPHRCEPADPTDPWSPCVKDRPW